MAAVEQPQQESPHDFSVMEQEPPLQLARWLHFAPPGGFGAGRRALGLALFCWVPIAVWAVYTGNVTWGPRGESVLQHYSVHVRCLVFIPLLILAEPLFYRMTRMFGRSLAIATNLDADSFSAVLGRMCRLRNSGWPWLLLLVITLLVSFMPGIDAGDDAISWARERDGQLGFGGMWFLWVVRPLSTLLLLGWLWRLALMTVWLVRVARLRPELVPAHPDRAAGIGFLEDLPISFSLVTFAVSVQIAARLAHEMLQHGATLQSYQLPLTAFAVFWSLLMLAPLLAFVPTLLVMRRRALLEYSALVGRQGRLTHRRWIKGEAVGDDPVLGAPEIGPIADAATMYDIVRRIKPMPFGLRALLGILIPLAVPVLVLWTLQMPLREIGLYVLKVLA